MLDPEQRLQLYKDSTSSSQKGIVEKILRYPLCVSGRYPEEWSREEVKEFLASLKADSLGTLKNTMLVINICRRAAAQELGIQVEPVSMFIDDYIKLIDEEAVAYSIITIEEYEKFIQDFYQIVTAKKAYFREFCSSQLAWFGLSVNEIQNLKKQEIHFPTNEQTKQKAVLLQVDNRTVYSEDELLVKSVEQCLCLDIVNVPAISKLGKKYTRSYRLANNDFLIRTTVVGNTKDEKKVTQRGFFFSITDKLQTIEGYQLDKNFSLENLKRSGKVYQYFVTGKIADPQNLSKKYWDRLAQIVYGKQM